MVVRPEDRPWVFLVHALGWVPIWGFAFNAALWLYFRNRSRELVFHVQQAIQFHILVLGAMVLWAVCGLFTGIVGRLNIHLGEFLSATNDVLLSVCLTAAAFVAIVGGGLAYTGRPFLYPILGRRVLESSIRKYTED